MSHAGLVACFSYLAAAELWQVDRFPLANHGAEVTGVEPTVAADGPMAAAVLSALHVPTLLISNDVGDDSNGTKVRTWLKRYGVKTTASISDKSSTPQIVVVADNQGTRTWFPHLPGVTTNLATIDLSPMAGASFAYIDCYQIIEAPAVWAIRTARSAGVPLLLNLGGSPLSPEVVAAVEGHPRLLVQTNVDDTAHRDASKLASELRRAMGAEWAVVTAGAHGAVAVSKTDRLFVPAFRVTVRHTHCAGAAFSGGLLYCLLRDWPMDKALEFACASGALRCERAQDAPMPTFDELQVVIGSRQRLGVTAA